jgi:N-acetyl-gamma-glutamyl-phosphate reductase|tara:strand:+ start:6987 stop:8000 length:1014 start_codon:yes stop_codon:yes gene_type:complete
MPINVCIFGVSGYTGSKLLFHLIKHKHVNILAVFGQNSIGKNLTELFPNISESSDLKITSFNDFKFENVDLIFSCLPHGKFQNNIISNLDLNIPIIDLSGDFRLEDKTIYEDFYNIKHKNFNLKKKFVYGLSEVYRNQISKAKYICNPGCYPTSILIPLIPLLKEKVIKSGHIIIDSKSGVSGAGKKLVETNLFSELNNNFYSYSVEKHKHFPEINQELMKINKKVSFTFIPHLLPVFSGLQSNIYIDYDGDKIKDIQNVLLNYYSKEPFVKLNFKDPQKLSNVQGTNNISINVFSDYEKKRIMIISCLDNLIKGAAGQAIQNMNIMFNFGETEALL